MRSLERAIATNVKGLTSSFDATLLHPPISKPTENFYPKTLEKMKEYREYYAKKILNIDRMRKVHMYKGHLRNEDALDAALRGLFVFNSKCIYKSHNAVVSSKQEVTHKRL
jgi:hypothetical protein